MRATTRTLSIAALCLLASLLAGCLDAPVPARADGASPPAPAAAATAGATAPRAEAAGSSTARAPLVHEVAAAPELPPLADPLYTLGVDARSVRALAARGEHLFVATAGGLLVVDLRGEAPVLERHLTRRDGLAGHDLRALTLAGDGALWLGFGDGACQQLPAASLVPQACPRAFASEAALTAFAEHGGAMHALTWRGEVLGPSAVAGEGGEGVRGGAEHLVSCGGALIAASLRRGVWRVDGGAPLPAGGPQLVAALACHDGALVAGGPQGAVRLDAASGAWQPLALGTAPRRHVSVLVSSGAALVLALADGTVLALEPGADAPATIAALPATPVAVWSDDAGELWLGGPELLARLEPGEGARRVGFVALPGPGEVDLADVAVVGDVLAVGLFRGGVGLLDTASGASAWRRFTTRDGLPSDEVNTLAAAGDGSLWVGTSRGLARIELTAIDAARDGLTRSDPTGSELAPEGRVAAVVGLEQGLPCLHVNDLVRVGERLLVATSCGLGTLELATGTLVDWAEPNHGLPHRIVYAVTVWNGELVAGTNDGLATRPLDEPEARWQVHRAGGEGAWRDNWITALAVHPDGRLLVGTYSGGLVGGPSLDALVALPGPRYVNLNAIHVDAADGTVRIGGLSEGAHELRADGSARTLPAGLLPGDDVTGFATLRDGRIVVATRAGLWPLAREE